MQIDWFTVAAQTINFLVLMWLLKRFLYKPILNAIAAREKNIADQLVLQRIFAEHRPAIAHLTHHAGGDDRRQCQQRQHDIRTNSRLIPDHSAISQSHKAMGHDIQHAGYWSDSQTIRKTTGPIPHPSAKPQ